MEAQLREVYASGPERGGLILNDGRIIELPNIAEDPLQGYQPDDAQLLSVIGQAVATWHTHPDCSANLSVEDWESFVNWPDMIHIIIGNDGARWYQVRNGAVINA